MWWGCGFLTCFPVKIIRAAKQIGIFCLKGIGTMVVMPSPSQQFLQLNWPQGNRGGDNLTDGFCELVPFKISRGRNKGTIFRHRSSTRKRMAIKSMPISIISIDRFLPSRSTTRARNEKEEKYEQACMTSEVFFLF